jgi:hypothetical protein
VTLNGGGAGDPVADAVGDGPGELLADGVPAGAGAAAVVSTGPVVVGGGLGDDVVATGAGVVAGPPRDARRTTAHRLSQATLPP